MIRMNCRQAVRGIQVAALALTGLAVGGLGGAAEAERKYVPAVVVLVENAEVRRDFEDSIVAKAQLRGYQPLASYPLVPRVSDFERRKFPEPLRKQGVNVVFMVRPAAVGPGSSLESVRDSLPPDLYREMREFAGSTSQTDTDDLIAVLHVAIYSLAGDKPRLVSAGAVWLNEPVTGRQQGIDRLQEMLLANVDAAREEIREHLEEAEAQAR